ncbi:hypothetical protein D3C72_2573820 [compost metagenome]
MRSISSRRRPIEPPIMTFSGLAIAAIALMPRARYFAVSSKVAAACTSPFAARSKIAGTVAVSPDAAA